MPVPMHSTDTTLKLLQQGSPLDSDKNRRAMTCTDAKAHATKTTPVTGVVLLVIFVDSSVLAVLGRQMSNSYTCVERAASAHRDLDLTGVFPVWRAKVAKRAPRLNEHELRRLVERYQWGATIYDLAREFGISRGTAAQRLKDSGVQMRNLALSEAEVRRAIALYGTGLSVASVGRELQRDHAAIWRALTAAGVRLRDTHGRPRG